MTEVKGSGREELPHTRGQGQQPGGAPTVQGVVAAQAQEGREELLYIQGQGGGGEEVPLVQAKEQRLHFAGAAVKRYPKSKVR